MDYLPSLPLNVTPLMVFGFMLFIGSIGGYLAHRVSRLPSITGFIIVGFICGPGGLGLLSQETMAESRILIDIALALILYRLGLSLDIKPLFRSSRLLLTSLVESFATFVVVAYVLYLFDVSVIVAALLAAIAISSSPAVLLHVAHEVDAEGEVTESSKTLVALNNLISFVAFSAILPALHFSSGADWATIVFQPLYRLAGSFLLGLVIGFCLHFIALRMHQSPQYRLALVIGAIMIGIGLASELKLSALFVPLVIGVLVKSIEQKVVVSELSFGPSFELFFIILFVFAGASLHLEELVDFAPVVLALVLARGLAKIIGVTAISALHKSPLRTGMSSGLLLLPMAGLALGLVQTGGNLFPQHGSYITAIVVGAVSVFETIGPPIAAFAFHFAGESAVVRNQDGPLPGAKT